MYDNVMDSVPLRLSLSLSSAKAEGLITRVWSPTAEALAVGSSWLESTGSESCLFLTSVKISFPIPSDQIQETMTRRCSHCSHNGHNSRTCPNRGVKLFGVRLTDGSIRKSASMGNLSHYAWSGSGLNLAGSNTPGSPGETPDHGAAADGYASEDFVPGSSSSCRDRKKGLDFLIILCMISFFIVLNLFLVSFLFFIFWDIYFLSLKQRACPLLLFSLSIVGLGERFRI